MNDEFALRLRQERKRLGYKQVDFGKLGGVTLATQSRYELGSSLPDAGYLTKIAALGVDVQFVLTGGRVAGDYVQPNEADLLTRYRALPDPARTAFRYLVGSYGASSKEHLVELPSEDALARMFQAMLLPLDLGDALEETARTFAQQLPASIDAATPENTKLVKYQPNTDAFPSKSGDVR